MGKFSAPIQSDSPVIINKKINIIQFDKNFWVMTILLKMLYLCNTILLVDYRIFRFYFYYMLHILAYSKLFVTIKEVRGTGLTNV